MNLLTKALSAKTILLLTTVILISSLESCTKKQAEEANVLHTFSQAKIKGLDPIQASDVYSGTETGRVYEGLLQYSYLKRPYVLEPALAESMPVTSKDGKTITIKLKKGVLFQDDAAFKSSNGKGRELIASDVIYSWKRLADPKNHSESFWLIDGKIVGLNEWAKKASEKGTADYTADIEGLKALDNYTLEIKLIKPNYQFMYMLAMPAMAIVAREAVEMYGDQFINHAVGTGPFRLQEFNPASKLIWVRNPTFRTELYPSEGTEQDKVDGHLADAGKPLPFLDKIIVEIIVEYQPQWLKFMKGELDFSGIPKDNYAQAIAADGSLTAEMKAKKLTLVRSAKPDITHSSFNMMDPVVGKNKSIRQAISLAYNMDQAIELFYNGRALNAQSPIPPGITGYDESFKNPYKTHNIEKAKELMKKAGYGPGKELEIEYLTLTDSTSRQWTEYRQKELAEIGVKLKVSTFSWPEFVRALKDKKGQIWSYAWNGDYPDAENFLQLFYGKNKSPGPNDSNFDHPEFNKLYEQSLTLADSPARTALYRKMIDIVTEESPWIPEVHRLGYTLVQPTLKNFKPHDFDHTLSKYYRIIKAQ